MTILTAAAALCATPALAMPDGADIAEALGHATGVAPPPAEAVDIVQCSANPDGPGYDCVYSIDLCVESGADPAQCDNPGVNERAIFVGGDNGWYAFDNSLFDDGRTPRLPLDRSSPLLSELTEQWLWGSWNPEGNCENDATFFLNSDGSFHAMSEEGRWALDGYDLVVTVTADAGVEGGEMTRLATPRTTRWPLSWGGLNAGGVTTPDGQFVSMVRCS